MELCCADSAEMITFLVWLMHNLFIRLHCVYILLIGACRLARLLSVAQGLAVARAVLWCPNNLALAAAGASLPLRSKLPNNK